MFTKCSGCLELAGSCRISCVGVSMLSGRTARQREMQLMMQTGRQSTVLIKDVLVTMVD